MSKILDNKKNIFIMVAGVGAVAAGLIMRKKATLKCMEIIKEFEEVEELIDKTAEECDEYTEENKEKDHETNKIQTAIKVVSVYAVPYTSIVVGGCLILNGSLKTFNKK